MNFVKHGFLARGVSEAHVTFISLFLITVSFICWVELTGQVRLPYEAGSAEFDDAGSLCPFLESARLIGIQNGQDVGSVSFQANKQEEGR